MKINLNNKILSFYNSFVSKLKKSKWLFVFKKVLLRNKYTTVVWIFFLSILIMITIFISLELYSSYRLYNLKYENGNLKNLTENLIIKEHFVKIITLCLAMVGIIVTLWRTSAQERALSFDRVKFAKEQSVNIYSRSIELLGSEKIAVRIGSLYSLKKLAEEDEFYILPLIDIIKGYLRSELKSPEINSIRERWKQELDGWTESKQNEKPRDDFEKSYEGKPYINIPEDIKVCLIIISKINNRKIIDFSGINWTGFDFSDSELSKFKLINFSNSNFSHTLLDNITLDKCIFYKVNLDNAYVNNFEFNDRYRGETGSSVHMSFNADRAYLKIFKISHIWSWSTITNSRIHCMILSRHEGEKSGLPLFNELHFYNSAITYTMLFRKFNTLIFDKCALADIIIDKSSEKFNGLYLIDCNIRISQSNDSFFSNIDPEYIPADSYKEKNVNIIFIDKGTYCRHRFFDNKFMFKPVTINQEFFVYFNPRRDDTKHFFGKLSKRNDIGFLARKK